MSNNNNGNRVKSLQELKPEDFPVLELRNPSGLGPGELSQKTRIIVKDQERIQEWVATLLAQMTGRDAEVAGKTDPKERRVAEQLAQRANKKDQEALDKFLWGGETDPFHRQAAWIALLTYWFSQNLRSPEEVKTLLGELERKGYLKKGGPLKAYNQNYTVSPDSLLEEPELMEIAKNLEGLLHRVHQEVEKARAEKASQLSAQATITLAELRQGIPGKAFLEIPSEEVRDADGNTKFWRGGGVLLVESDGEKIIPLGASGAIEQAVEEMMRFKTHLLIKSLSWTIPPYIPSLTLEQGKKVQLLWHLVQRTPIHA